MHKESPMRFATHQHLQMAKLIRRKASHRGNPPHLLGKANLFLALARAARQAQRPQQPDRRSEILNRYGFDRVAIAAMTPQDRATAIREAITNGISVAPQPPAAQVAQAPIAPPRDPGGPRNQVARLVIDSGVPAHHLDPADLHNAAQLIERAGMNAHDAFELAAVRDALERNLVTAAQVDQIYGPGVAQHVRNAGPAPRNVQVA
jgi:hypothetical protein